MILRGLLVAAAGFAFIFSPGLPLSWLVRRAPGVQRGLIYWGLALWPAALLPALFLQSLLRQAVQGGSAAPRPADYLSTLAGTLITALVVQGAMLLVLRFKRPAPGQRLLAGLSLGFGIGLVSQVFTGLALVSAGFRLALGDLGDPMLARFAEAGGWSLALSLIPLLLFRPALLVVCAARGLLVARSLAEGMRLWLAAVALDALFSWAAIAIQIALGVESPGLLTAGSASSVQAVAGAVYYIAAFGLAFWWLSGQLAATAAGAARPDRPAARLVQRESPAKSR